MPKGFRCFAYFTASSTQYCAAPSDLSLIMFTDHLHEHGTSIFNEVIHADGTHQMLASDPSWTRDMIFNPTWHNWDLANPVAVKMGDQLHVHCEWQSTVDKAVKRGALHRNAGARKKSRAARIRASAS